MISMYECYFICSQSCKYQTAQQISKNKNGGPSIFSGHITRNFIGRYVFQSRGTSYVPDKKPRKSIQIYGNTRRISVCSSFFRLFMSLDNFMSQHSSLNSQHCHWVSVNNITQTLSLLSWVLGLYRVHVQFFRTKFVWPGLIRPVMSGHFITNKIIFLSRIYDCLVHV